MNDQLPVPSTEEGHVPERINYRALKLQLGEAQNWRCCYCGFRVEPRSGWPSDPDTATIEHIVPRVRGGTYDADNLAIACFQCNTLRGHSHVYHFITVVTKLLQHDIIRQHWHSLNRQQSRILLFEVRFGLLYEKVKAGEASNAEVLELIEQMEQRREQFAKP